MRLNVDDGCEEMEPFKVKCAKELLENLKREVEKCEGI